MVSDLTTRLRAFNRKERFLLVGQALGNPAFTLGSEFRSNLGLRLGRDVPEDAYCAMDYHLDWLYAALMWSCGQVHPKQPMPREKTDPFLKNGAEVTGDLKVTGNQSDIDLLVAWTDSRQRAQVVMIEAKGFSAWTQGQMAYKSSRLKAIFGDAEHERFPEVDAHLVLAGPGAPPPTILSQGPAWTHGPSAGNSKYFLPLDPPPHRTFAVQRVVQTGKPSHTGTHWLIHPAPWPGGTLDQASGDV